MYNTYNTTEFVERSNNIIEEKYDSDSDLEEIKEFNFKVGDYSYTSINGYYVLYYKSKNNINFHITMRKEELEIDSELESDSEDEDNNISTYKYEINIIKYNDEQTLDYYSKDPNEKTTLEIILDYCRP